MLIASENQYVEGVRKYPGQGFDVIVSGTFAATVTVEVSKDGLEWFPIKSIASPGVYTGELGTSWLVRAGVATGDYTSGTVQVGVH